MRRLLSIAAGALLFTTLSPFVSPASAAPGCGEFDNPETGIPGEVSAMDQVSGRADRGYNCGLALIGYNNIGARGGNANMAWSGNCAYIAGDKGVAVMDVSDPTQPRFARTLHGKGSDISIETIAAIDAGDRHLLAAGRYGLLGYTGNPAQVPVDLYDTSDCAKPKFLTTYLMPSNVHTFTFSADGKRLFSTLPLQAIDVTNPRKPTYLGNLETDMKAQGVNHLYYAHEVALSPDNTRLYLGGQVIGDEEMIVLDIKDWPRKRAIVLGRLKTPGHSISRMTINGKPYLLNSDESVVSPTAKGCLPEAFTPFGGVAQPYLTDISNERAPKIVGKYRLPINEPQNCVQQVLDFNDSSVHFHNVDNTEKTTFAMLPMWNAGLRVIDVRNPAAPREVAYFNPGRFQTKNYVSKFRTTDGFARLIRAQGASNLDQSWAHTRYVPETGHIWLTTQSGGFWVLELEPQLRAALGLPAKHAIYPKGREARPKATRLRIGNIPGSVSASTAAMYCTLGPVQAAA